MTADDLRDNPFDALSDGDRRRLLDEVAEEALSADDFIERAVAFEGSPFPF